MHQVHRQAEKQLALLRAQEEKEEKDRLRQLAIDAQCKKARAERQLQEALVEVCSAFQPQEKEHFDRNSLELIAYWSNYKHR